MSIIDINKTIDTVKMKFYNEYLYTNHVYDEGNSDYHKELTTQVVSKYVDDLKLDKDSVILDLGCGPGYFLDEMKQRGYTNVVGVTLSHGDIKLCTEKGHTIKQYDLSFLPQNDGYYDESVDFIFSRHALEHSPYPIFTLMEYNRVLKQNGKMYIELPAPNCQRKHEYNPNHYSILGREMWIALLVRTGFDILQFDELSFELNMHRQDGNIENVTETFYVIVVNKSRPMDVK